MLKVFRVVLFVVCCSLSLQIFAQDTCDAVTFYSQEAIDTFGYCKVVNGHLGIVGDTDVVINDLSGLASIEEVLGSVSISRTRLTREDSLPELKYISNGLNFTYNWGELPSMPALQKIEGREVYFYFNDSLEYITPFSSLDSIQGVVVYNNPSLLDLSGFENVRYFGGWLDVHTNNSMTSINGFNALREVGEGYPEVYGSIRIQGPELRTINGFHQLDSIGHELSIANCPKLRYLNGFERLKKLNYLYFQDNPSLQALTGLDSIEWIFDDFGLVNNDSLVNLTGIGGVHRFGENGITLEENDQFENFIGLNQDSIKAITIYASGNPGILNLNGLGAVKNNLHVLIDASSKFNSFKGLSLTDTIQISIEGSEAIIDLKSISGVDSIDHLAIYNCPNFESTEGINELSFINALSLTDNPKLSACCQILNIDSITNLTLRNNARGCDSLADVELRCVAVDSCGTYGETVLLNEQEDLFSWKYCKTIRGDLRIVDEGSNDTITNLTPLNGLKKVDGNLHLDASKLLSLKGFDSLKNVSGNLSLLRMTDDNLSYLNQLSEIGETLEIDYFTFDSINWTGDLRKVGEFYLSGTTVKHLAGFDSLNTVEGQLLIFGNDSLESIDAFERLDSVYGDLRIVESPLLKIVSGFDSLEFVQNALEVYSCQSLIEIPKFEQLQSCSTLHFRSLDSLKKLEGFNQLDSLHFGIGVIGNSGIEELTGFTELKYSPTFQVKDNPNLNTCCGLIPLFDITTDSLLITNNGPACSSLEIIEDSCREYAGEVWPGDCNNDGVVNVFDVFPIGYNYGKQGWGRDSVDIAWETKNAYAWNDSFRNVNIMHANSNGDSIIDVNDVDAILSNYSLTHGRGTETIDGVGDDLKIVFEETPVELHEAFKGVIHLGAFEFNEIEAYAIAFEMHIESEGVLKLVDVDYSSTWLGTEDEDLIGIHKDLQEGEESEYSFRQIDFGWVRTDNNSIIGGGPIGDVVFVIDDIVGGRDLKDLELKVHFENIQLLVDEDSVISIDSDTSSKTIQVVSTAIENIRIHETLIYPNPAINEVNIYSSYDDIETVEVYTSKGELIYGEEVFSAQVKIETNDFNQGIYLIHVKHKSGFTKVEKLLISK